MVDNGVVVVLMTFERSLARKEEVGLWRLWNYPGDGLGKRRQMNHELLLPGNLNSYLATPLVYRFKIEMSPFSFLGRE